MISHVMHLPSITDIIFATMRTAVSDEPIVIAEIADTCKLLDLRNFFFVYSVFSLKGRVSQFTGASMQASFSALFPVLSSFQSFSQSIT
jgi:hypothetical protein